MWKQYDLSEDGQEKGRCQGLCLGTSGFVALLVSLLVNWEIQRCTLIRNTLEFEEGMMDGILSEEQNSIFSHTWLDYYWSDHHSDISLHYLFDSNHDDADRTHQVLVFLKRLDETDVIQSVMNRHHSITNRCHIQWLFRHISSGLTLPLQPLLLEMQSEYDKQHKYLKNHLLGPWQSRSAHGFVSDARMVRAIMRIREQDSTDIPSHLSLARSLFHSGFHYQSGFHLSLFLTQFFQFSSHSHHNHTLDHF